MLYTRKTAHLHSCDILRCSFPPLSTVAALYPLRIVTLLFVSQIHHRQHNVVTSCAPYAKCDSASTFPVYVAVPQCCAIGFIDASDDQLNAALCSAVLRSSQAHRQKLPVEAKYNAANDKANFARIRGSTIDLTLCDQLSWCQVAR